MLISPYNHRKQGKGFFAIVTIIASFLLLSLSVVAFAEESDLMRSMHHSKDYLISVDPATSERVGGQVLKQIRDFFDYADNAIKTKDIDSLSELYSDRYLNGSHKKSDILATWKTLFGSFNDLTMTHNLRFISFEPNSNLIIVQCSGFLMGIPQGEKSLVALDSWMNMDHVLVKEDGRWKIVGSYGKEQKRLWFDKAMHPLF